ncbi:PadR family transcriptional regulator [Bacillus cereus]|uniref:PadR family transcriptional regulator n=1 Tax=Bacillus cereus group TaxID=86661 RepID=UPI0001A121D5|nr:PadR family transcriptional regulator [Bacillus cereus]EEL73471.1 transcriptional regulator [Bacillus cereus AH676]KMP88007.1 PadR family transcriptional regulator [Bacillus cereus]MCC2365642.1 PadR family transcriptional regulator [Bacillus cereus]MCC2450620.1 PadR family transcriptional regulator [Bacillus cereus]MCC2490698.1 PadR family transcriptional regulator [Bacillus cereus]
MNVQFKKGVLELCVLALVKRKDSYGYELVQQISNKFLISEGSVYPLLRRLTKEGYFQTYLKESTEGPPRKYYQLTEQGETHFHLLVTEWRDFAKGVQEIIEGVEWDE